jgi:hypothetical protein
MKNLLVAPVFACLALSACSALPRPLEEPKVAVKHVEITPNQMGIQGTLDLDVTNPNGVALPLRSIDYTVELTGGSAYGVMDLAQTIPAKGSVPVRAILAAQPTAIAAGAVGYALGARRYKLSGTAYFRTSLGDMKVPFSQEGTL